MTVCNGAEGKVSGRVRVGRSTVSFLLFLVSFPTLLFANQVFHFEQKTDLEDDIHEVLAEEHFMMLNPRDRHSHHKVFTSQAKNFSNSGSDHMVKPSSPEGAFVSPGKHQNRGSKEESIEAGMAAEQMENEEDDHLMYNYDLELMETEEEKRREEEEQLAIRIKRSATTEGSGIDSVNGRLNTSITYAASFAETTSTAYLQLVSDMTSQIVAVFTAGNIQGTVTITGVVKSHEDTVIEFTLTRPVEMIDRVPVAEALLNLRTSGVTHQNQNHSVPVDPEIEDAAGVFKVCSCIICEQYPYKECIPSNADHTRFLCQTKSLYYSPYGSNQNDSTLRKGLLKSTMEFSPPAGIPIQGRLVFFLSVSMHGLISFGGQEAYGSFQNRRLPVEQYDLLCAYWTQVQLLDEDSRSKIWVKEYIRNENSTAADIAVLNNGGEQVRNYNSISSYHAVYMLIVTYEDVPPYGSPSNTSERANFQVKIISDGYSTYGIIVYAAGGMQWLASGGYSVTIGSLSFNVMGINTASPDASVGNTNRRGVWFFELSSIVDNPGQNCLNWYLDELPQEPAYTDALAALPPCPCWRAVVTLTASLRRYDVNEDDVVCFTTPANFQHARLCCYRVSTNSFIQGLPLAGTFLRFHPDNSDDHFLKDREPKQFCCSSGFCNLYYTVRPFRDCARRVNSRQSMGSGDPHITTFDNKTFTFNGVGEFVYFKFQVPGFEMQTRTCPLTNSEGREVASVFCAFAAKGGNSTFQVEMSNSKTGLVVYIDNQDLTTQFNTAPEFKPTANGLSVQRISPTSIQAYFVEDIGITISVENHQLTIQTDLRFDNKGPPPTGLMGNLNNDPEDDFIFPNGTTLPGDTNERDLLSYGKTWAITDTSSLFYYEGGWGTSHFTKADFMPIFLSEITPQQRADAENVCGEAAAISCIYDYFATKDESLAVGTKNAFVKLQTDIQTAANRVPTVTGTAEVKVTVGKPTELRFSAQDEDEADSITYDFRQQPSAGFTFNETTQTAQWTPMSNNLSSVEVTVRDSKGAASPTLQVRILQCSGCNDHGQCNFDKLRRTGNEYFQFATCDCQPYYSGQDCEGNRNFCMGDPCPQSTTCTDLTVDEHKAAGAGSLGYNCSDCPAGYVQRTGTDAITCDDVDECKLPTPPCQQNCVNTVGSYTCSCNSGYRKDTDNDTRCIDIDECQRNTHNCEQQCVNTAGTFNCSCYAGFSPNITATNKCVQDTAQDPCEGLGTACDYACRNESGSAVCLCPVGFQLANQTHCGDINECDLKLCSQKCANSEGSYTCSCFSGFLLDADKVTCSECPTNQWGDDCKQTCDCRGRGTCDRVKGCVCNNGWTGSTCSVDIDECKTIANACPASQICQNNAGSFACVCPTGFKKVGDACNDIDECAVPTSNTCPQKCTNSQGSFICSCNAGYSYDSGTNTCVDIDECQTDISNCQYQCENFPGSANCICGPGFELNDDRRTCSKVLDPCAALAATKNCSYACQVVDNKAQCYCADGFELHSDGLDCIDIDECESNSTNKCTQRCDNTQGNYQCSCSTGYTLGKDQRTCTVCDGNHWGENCTNTCDCNPVAVQRCDRQTGCVCKDGWRGTRCELDKDECQTAGTCSPISNSVCINTAGSFRCDCPAGYALNANKDTCEDVNECNQSPKPCDQECANTQGSFVCSCAAGFNPVGSNCVDIDECLTRPCDQICRNTVGGFFCECEPGLVLNATTKNTCYVQTECGTNSCEHGCVHRPTSNVDECFCRAGFVTNTTDSNFCADIDECEKNPCVNGTCSNSPGSFSCSCATGSRLLPDRLTCQVCPQDTFGDGCSKNCSCVTANTKSCDPVSGTCQCRDGWEGMNCGTDKKECAQTPSPCANVSNSQCQEMPGSFRCKCNTGFFTSSGQCLPCDDHHYGLECSTPCTCSRSNTADCNDVNGTCTCKPQWKGENCTEDVDECSPTDPCQTAEHEKCRNTIGSHVCDCVDGFARPSPKENCTDINECDRVITCNRTVERCVNKEGSFDCLCLEGYVRSNVTGKCQPCDDLHYGVQCSSTCACARNNTADCNDVDGTCTCKPQWKGENCTEDVDECSPTDPCPTDKQEKCRNTVGGYVCDCVQSYVRPAAGGDCQATSVTVTIGVVIILDFNPIENLTDTTTTYYVNLANDVRTQLRIFYRDNIGDAFVDVIIIELTIGSLNVSYDLQVNANRTDNPQGLVSKATKALLDSEVTIQGLNVTVNSVTLNKQAPLTQNSTVCDIFTTINACNSTHPCTVDSASGEPRCIALPEDTDNLDLVIGLGVGIPLFLLAAFVIAVVVYIHIKRRRYNDDDTASDQTASVFAGKLPTMGQWGVAHKGLYSPADNRSLSGSDSSEGHMVGAGKAGRHGGRSDFKDSAWYDRHQPFATQTTATSGGNGAGAFSWEYIFNMLSPYNTERPFEIRRPHVTPSPDRMTQSRRHRDTMA